MRRLRHLSVLFVLAALLTTGVLSSGGRARAQSVPSAPPGACLSVHEVHPDENLTATGAKVPLGFKRILSHVPGGELIVREIPFVTGDDLADAEADSHPATGQPILVLRFSVSGRVKLASFTKDNVGQRIAFVVDGRLMSAPKLLQPILGGTAWIAGDLSTKDAANLASKLKAKACSAQ